MTESALSLICGDETSDCLSVVTGGKGSPSKESEAVTCEYCVDSVAYLTKDAFVISE